ncbi:MAG: hypothetical protein L0332_22540 [Chloroflexi bacterium]|nr:hypothetical protein [Chloroflexota bacterium]MCI0577969.1 hypothetical protein [Chloroflexota bacterium]MCI0649279.1 hypothetical protein [Chloroflexota bacterium]MCI0729472.1 hypothetical protein [Chloroflexota bacterium]
MELSRAGRTALFFLLFLLVPAQARAAGGFSATPLIDMGPGDNYLGFPGRLYPGPSNVMPVPHHLAGLERATAVQPLDTAGAPDPAGKIVFLSVGMSNTATEFCGHEPDGVTCTPWSFIGQASQDPAVNHTTLVMINGAKAGQDADAWDSPAEENYNRIRDAILAPLGLAEAQVQVVWLKVANAEAGLAPSLPAAQADAYLLLTYMGNIVRALRVRYPNLRQLFVSSRIYAGYATTILNPEPYAYESGLAVQWLVAAQINQMNGQPPHPLAGDLDYNSLAPWLAWGPYLWADGLNPRSDGLTWAPADFASDGTHPSPSGQAKVALLLLRFFKNSPLTACWFLASGRCRGPNFLPLILNS